MKERRSGTMGWWRICFRIAVVEGQGKRTPAILPLLPPPLLQPFSFRSGSHQTSLNIASFSTSPPPSLLQSFFRLHKPTDNFTSIFFQYYALLSSDLTKSSSPARSTIDFLNSPSRPRIHFTPHLLAIPIFCARFEASLGPPYAA